MMGRLRSFHLLRDQDSLTDPEKYASFQDIDVSSEDEEGNNSRSSDHGDRDHIPSGYSSSSRETSGSYQPMLRPSTSSANSNSHHKYHLDSYRRPPSRRTIRYLCLTLFTTLVIFILALVRASHVSSKQLELGPVEKTTPTRPPAWEDFPFLKRYFGGIRSLVPRDANSAEYPNDEYVESEQSNIKTSETPKSIPFDPYSNISGIQECFLDAQDTIRIPRVHFYDGVTSGMPDPIIGTYDNLGLRNDVCFDRYGRLGPYGYGYSVKRGGTGAGLDGERAGAEDMWTQSGSIPEVDYGKVRWANAQHACMAKNKGRFEEITEQTSSEHLFTKSGHTSSANAGRPDGLARRDSNDTAVSNASVSTSETIDMTGPRLARSAVVIRTWWDHRYSLEDIVYLRSLVAELALLSGGEYTVHFLIHVKDDNVPIWADKQIYDRVLENSLPEEFRGMGSLWSERQMSLIYGGLHESFFRDLPVHGVYRGLYMALQYFSHQHPEYDYLWNWEMDVRYTGQWYHLFDQVRQWTKAQPRKELWERNGRFYVQSVHGSWEDFKQMIRVQSEMGTNSPNNIWSGLKAGPGDIPGSAQGKTDKPVWGPESPPDMLGAQDDPEPPRSIDKDRYEWGVGEEADLITFSPMFDPDGTTWFYVDDVTGYNTSTGLPPRRAAIGASARLSRRLLQTMHRETILARHHMFSEMWPASIALHHGYKAVYAPHPVFVDRKWPTSYFADVMNGGRNGASGGARTSVYGGREHNFKGQTWFYDAGFSPNLWRRWLGYKVDNDGGEQAEVAGEGRMCLPAILLHPVKGVEFVVEGGAMVDDAERTGEAEFGDASVIDSELDWESTG